MTNGDEQNPAGGEQQSQPASDMVQLSREEYANMVSTNAQMRAQMDQLLQYIETNKQQPKPQAQAQPNMPTADVDSMSNTQLLQFINQQMAQPLLNTVMQMAVKEELREVEGKYEDFKDFKDQVYQLASTNTSLSLEQAYLLAKSGKPAPPQKEEKKPTEEKPVVPPSQKPASSVGSKTLEASGPLSIKEAAAAALKELQYE